MICAVLFTFVWKSTRLAFIARAQIRLREMHGTPLMATMRFNRVSRARYAPPMRPSRLEARIL